MSGDVLKRIIASRQGDMDGGPPDDEEDMIAQSFGFLRGMREQSLMFEIRCRNGRQEAFKYSWLEHAVFDPSEGITLELRAQDGAHHRPQPQCRGAAEPSSVRLHPAAPRAVDSGGGRAGGARRSQASVGDRTNSPGVSETRGFAHSVAGERGSGDSRSRDPALSGGSQQTPAAAKPGNQAEPRDGKQSERRGSGTAAN